MARSVAELAGKLDGAGRALRGESRRAVGSAAYEFKVGIERQFARDGLRRGSKLAGRPWRGVSYQVKTDSRVLVMAAKPSWLFNNPTSPHPIAPRQRRGKKALAFNGIVRARVVQHPGTRGTGSWGKGAELSRPAAFGAYAKVNRDAVAAVFRG